MKHKMMLAIFMFLFAIVTTSACKDSGSKSDPAPGANPNTFDAVVTMNDTNNLLTQETGDVVYKTGTVKISNPGPDVQINISEKADDCEVGVEEAEPMDKTTWTLVFAQSYYEGYTSSASCSRTLTFLRTTDNLTVTKTVTVNFAATTTTDDPASGGASPGPSPGGSVAKMCSGIVSPCYLRSTQFSCYEGKGCYWSSFSNDCSGYVSPCYIEATESLCKARTGCFWQ